jgi:Bacterial transcriptional activator domain
MLGPHLAAAAARQRGRVRRAARGRALREALALWRGPPLADLAYEPFAQAPIARPEELRLHALEQRIDAGLATGRTRSSWPSWKSWSPRTLCEFRGRLADVLPEIRDSVAEYPTRPVFRGALAHCHARLGRLAESGRAFGELAAAEFVLPFDQEWLLAMSLLAETSALLRRRDSAAVLHRLLTPSADLNVGDHPEGDQGVGRALPRLPRDRRRVRGRRRAALRRGDRCERAHAPVACARPARLHAHAARARRQRRPRAGGPAARPADTRSGR